MNAYNALVSRNGNIAKLTDERPELAELFMKVLQGIYNYLIRFRVKPSKIRISKYYNEHGLILKLDGKGSSRYHLEALTKRNVMLEGIVRSLSDISSLFGCINNYCRDRKNVSAILSFTGDKIIINGTKRGLYEN